MALREGSLTAAADRLGISPAAVGQRIRALEDFLGEDLLLRGRSGLSPTSLLAATVEDLRQAFDALGRVAEALDLQRAAEIHVVADADWADLWLLPRLPDFRLAYPNIRFCINGVGDAPMRLGMPDLRVTYGPGPGEVLYRDILLPVSGPDNLRRMSTFDPALPMEGMPLMHLREHRAEPDRPGWVEWFRTFGHREEGVDRGVTSPSARIAMEGVRNNVAFLVCGYSLFSTDLAEGSVVLPFPVADHLPAPHPYRLSLRHEAGARPQLHRFVTWLRAEAKATAQQILGLTKGAGGPSTEPPAI